MPATELGRMSKAMITEDRLPEPGHIGSKTGYGVLILT